MPEGEGEARWGLVGRSPAMERLRRQIETYGPRRELDVHISGETGTGKELVARALHEASGLRGRPVAFNAAGFNDDLFTAELFGHARGAFTGAVTARGGYVAAAEGGTLFLDEIGDLSERGQVGLLRFLEEREYRRLGETTVRRANLRVVSATNVDLSRRVAEHRFRKDLLYRLVRGHIVLPPLRQRGRDPVVLARHFLRLACGEARSAPELTPEAEGAIARFSWPGNVRQLHSEVMNLLVHAAHGRIHLHHLSREVREATRPRQAGLRAQREEFERERVREALERHQGNRTAAAADLGLSRQGLAKAMRRLAVLSGRNGSS